MKASRRKYREVRKRSKAEVFFFVLHAAVMEEGSTHAHMYSVFDTERLLCPPKNCPFFNS